MLKRLKYSDWLALAALLLFCGFWFLALTGRLPIPESPPQKQPIQASATSAEQESIEDISAETVAYYTKVLAWFTGILAIFACLQMWLLFRTDKTARDGLETADKQTQISAAQAEIAIQQKEIMRQQYLAAHRPRVIVRMISMQKPQAGIRMRISYRLVNIGGMPAYIDDIEATVLLAYPGIPEVLQWIVSVPKIAGTKLEPGEYKLLSTGDTLPAYEEAWNIRFDAPTTLNIHGTIAYRDERQTKMGTGFDRDYRPEKLLFRPVEDSEREYAD